MCHAILNARESPFQRVRLRRAKRLAEDSGEKYHDDGETPTMG
jgi:hypothetical protein